FECLDAESRGYRALIDALRANRLRIETFPDPFSTYAEEVEGLTMKDYLARRSPEMQSFMRQQVEAFAQNPRGQFAVASGGRDLAPAIVDYALVDLQSWKEQEFFPDCLAAVQNSAARESVLRMALLYIDDRPAAAQTWIVSGGRATM